MKKLIVVLSVCTTTLQAAYIPSNWQTNEIALLPRKTFGGFEPVLLVSKVPHDSQWHVVPLKSSSGNPKWNFDKVFDVKETKLLKFPLRNRLVVEEFEVRKEEIYIGKSRMERDVPFINCTK